METMEMCWACLFNKAPAIGDNNPEGEISYTGYKRVPVIAFGSTNLTEIVFPESEQDEPVFASHAVVIDGAGKVIGVKAL